MGIRKMVGVLLAIGFASLNLAIAQTAVDGAIGGNVKDGSGAFVAGAKVTVHNNGTGAEQSTISDDSGFFRVIHMLPGSYTVTVSAPGFRTYKADQVSVTVGSLTDLEPSLALGSTSETVEITSDAPAINTTNNDFTTTIGLKDLEDLPVNNYRWSAYALQALGRC